MPVNVVPPHEQMLLGGIPVGSMCELGSKQMGRYKQWFTHIGWKHVSIDLNGKGGALPLDLQKPINVEAIGGPFDVVTNFGTSEHVDEQRPCWENIHALLKVGGHLISSTPLDWPRHGRWYPQRDWYEQFCALNHYAIEELWIVTDRIAGKTISVKAKKTKDDLFIFPTVPMVEHSDGKTGDYDGNKGSLRDLQC